MKYVLTETPVRCARGVYSLNGILRFPSKRVTSERSSHSRSRGVSTAIASTAPPLILTASLTGIPVGPGDGDSAAAHRPDDHSRERESHQPHEEHAEPEARGRQARPSASSHVPKSTPRSDWREAAEKKVKKKRKIFPVKRALEYS